MICDSCHKPIEPKTCAACRTPTIVWGDANLGPMLTPSINGHVWLCKVCWDVTLANSAGLREWERNAKVLACS